MWNIFKPNVEKLAEKKNVEKLIKALHYQKDEEIRREAARALGEIADPRAVDPLIAALKDDGYDVRKAASEALGTLGWEPENDEDGAYYAIAQRDYQRCVSIGTHAVNPLIAALKDEFGVVRKASAETLGQIGDPRAVDPLIDALNDKKWDVDEKAAEALGQIGVPRAVDPLIAALNDKKWGGGEAAAEALGQIGDPRAVDALVAALKNKEKSWRLRTAAAVALGEIGDPRAVDPLIAALRYKDAREAASWALGVIGDPHAVNPLIKVLKDKKSTVRKAASEALGTLDWEPENDEDSAYYAIAQRDYQRCIKIGKPAVDPLIAALKDEDHNVREAAARNLGKMGDPRAVDPLIRALRDKDKRMRRAAARGLIKLHSQKTLDEDSRKQILSKRKAIIKKHQDLTTICPIQHTDRGIGVDFPL